MEHLKIDEVGEYSITLPDDAEQITSIIYNEGSINNLNMDSISILDCMAGVGGNTISFCKYFNKVIAVEYDKVRYDFLINNIKVFKIKNCSAYHNNCLNLIKKTYSKIIFFDPPWGGIDYLSKKEVNLVISGFSMWKIINYILNIHKDMLIFIKAPYNYDVIKLKQHLSHLNIGIKKWNIRKFNLLGIKLKNLSIEKNIV